MKRGTAASKLLLAAVSLVMAIILGTLAMIAVYCLPTRRMQDNVGHSLGIIELEWNRYTWAPGMPGTGLDGFTDCIMLGNAVYQGNGNPIQDAMLNPRAFYTEDDSPMSALTKYVNKSEIVPEQVVTYARYWHGYLTWLKPMLLFFTFSDIRMMNMVFQFALAGLLLVELYRLKGWHLALPFALAVFIINPISAALCMQYSSVYDVLLLSALVMVRFRLYASDYDWYVLLWVGILTAFLDFLTYPPAALGCCLVLMMALGEGNLKERIFRIARATAAWCLGYVGMWGGKWIVSSLLTDYNTLADAFGAVATRAGAEATRESGIEAVSSLDVIRANVHVLKNSASCLVLVCLMLLLLYLVVVKKYRFRFNMAAVASLFLIALYPFVWYAVIKNHSTVHCWMTHRSLSVTAFALSALIASSLYPSEGRKENG